jgi:hypothetical protein
VPDSPLLYFGLLRRLRATVLLTLLDTVSSQSSICVAHLSFCIQPREFYHSIKHEDEDLDLHKYNWVPHGMQIFNYVR